MRITDVLQVHTIKHNPKITCKDFGGKNSLFLAKRFKTEIRSGLTNYNCKRLRSVKHMFQIPIVLVIVLEYDENQEKVQNNLQ